MSPGDNEKGQSREALQVVMLSKVLSLDIRTCYVSGTQTRYFQGIISQLDEILEFTKRSLCSLGNIISSKRAKKCLAPVRVVVSHGVHSEDCYISRILWVTRIRTGGLERQPDLRLNQEGNRSHRCTTRRRQLMLVAVKIQFI
jgi:hypothetical protein